MIACAHKDTVLKWILDNVSLDRARGFPFSFIILRYFWSKTEPCVKHVQVNQQSHICPRLKKGQERIWCGQDNMLNILSIVTNNNITRNCCTKSSFRPAAHWNRETWRDDVITIAVIFIKSWFPYSNFFFSLTTIDTLECERKYFKSMRT